MSLHVADSHFTAHVTWPFSLCQCNLCSMASKSLKGFRDKGSSHHRLHSCPMPQASSILDSYLLNVQQNRFKKIYRAKHVLSKVEGTPSTQRKIPCHFDRREKSFLDPSHSLGMTALGPSPWRPLRLCVRRVFSDFFFIPKIGNRKSKIIL
jgi:hypothetical protein